jgi:hypothetical protein
MEKIPFMLSTVEAFIGFFSAESSMTIPHISCCNQPFDVVMLGLNRIGKTS